MLPPWSTAGPAPASTRPSRIRSQDPDAARGSYPASEAAQEGGSLRIPVSRLATPDGARPLDPFRPAESQGAGSARSRDGLHVWTSTWPCRGRTGETRGRGRRRRPGTCSRPTRAWRRRLRERPFWGRAEATPLRGNMLPGSGRPDYSRRVQIPLRSWELRRSIRAVGGAFLVATRIGSVIPGKRAGSACTAMAYERRGSDRKGQAGD